MKRNEPIEEEALTQSEPSKLRMLITQDGVVFIEIEDDEQTR